VDAPALSAVLAERLAALGSVERAEGQKRYLHSDLTHFGLRVPALRQITRQLLQEQHLVLPERVDLVEELWRQPVFDLRLAAVQVLEQSTRDLDVSHLALVERLIAQAGTWALVDPLATDVTGAIVRRFPEARQVLDRWVASSNFWVRRAALLAQLRPLRANPDPATFEAFATYADRVLDEQEFFIRKAIGWVLREVGKRNAALVVHWLAPRTHRASGVTMREAVKYLPADDAARLMDDYRARTIS
jgi:3-methyladenine DNA glycosylase AlkD